MPVPGSLCTAMMPPCPSIIDFARGSPSPIPWVGHVDAACIKVSSLNHQLFRRIVTGICNSLCSGEEKCAAPTRVIAQGKESFFWERKIGGNGNRANQFSYIDRSKILLECLTGCSNLGERASKQILITSDLDIADKCSA